MCNNFHEGRACLLVGNGCRRAHARIERVELALPFSRRHVADTVAKCQWFGSFLAREGAFAETLPSTPQGQAWLFA